MFRLTGLWLFWLQSPWHLAVWLGNRLCAGIGLLLAWRRVHRQPNRLRRFLPWMIAVNLVSFSLLVGFWWLRTH